MIVKYSKKFPYAPYLNEDIGFEMEVGEDIITNKSYVFAILATLKEMAEEFHESANPHLQYQSTELIPQGQQPLQSIDPKKADTIEKIQDCKTTDELEKWKSDAEKYGLMELWNEKNNSLK